MRLALLPSAPELLRLASSVAMIGIIAFGDAEEPATLSRTTTTAATPDEAKRISLAALDANRTDGNETSLSTSTPFHLAPARRRPAPMTRPILAESTSGYKVELRRPGGGPNARTLQHSPART